MSNRWHRLVVVLVGLSLVGAACAPREPSRQGAGASSQSGAGSSSSAQSAAPGPAQSERQPKRGGTLTLAINKDMVLMNPLVGTKSIDEQVRSVMYEPLLGLDLNGSIQPHLAESWEVSADGKVYTFKLRRGVKFHNGQEMTAEDLKFAIEYTRNPKNGAFGFNLLSMVERVEAPEPYVLRVYLKAVSPAFLSNVAWIKAFSAVPRDSIEEGVDKPAAFPPGTGPFKFVEWRPGQQIVLERFDDYWGHKAWVDRVVMRPVKDDSVRMTALRAGDVDMIQTAPLEWIRQVQDGKLPGIQVVDAPYADQRRLEFNVTSAPFNNKKLRQAVAHAIDKQEILHAAFFGFGTPGEQKYPKGHVWYGEGIPNATFDLERARALLRESGYNGETIDIMVEQSPSTEAQASTLQAQLRRIGVNLRLELLEYGMYSTRSRRGEFAIKFSGGSFDADPSTTYGPDLGCEADNTRRASNFTGYCEKDMDALLARAEVELDQARRKEQFRQILTKMYDDLPEMTIGFVPDFFAFREHVKGFVTDAEANLGWWGGGLHHAWLDR
jgi:ABC-type transport system substrate-binding protein